MKKKLNRLFKITMTIIVVILACTTVVNAYSFTPTMTPSSTTVQEGTEFTVTVKITNLDIGPNGVNAFSAKLEYDTNVFETVTASSVEGLSGWQARYEPDKKMIVLDKLQYAKTEENIFQITLKTKTGVVGKTGNIKLKEVKAADPTTEIKAQDVSTSIAVGKTSSNTSNTANVANVNNKIMAANIANKTKTNTAKNNSVSRTVNNTANVAKNVTKNVTNNSTGSPTEVPYTGAEDTVIKAIFVVMAVALIFYIKFEKINKEIK